jgi:hypothetical protein
LSSAAQERAFTSRWCRSGSFASRFLSVRTVQRWPSGRGHASFTAFQIPGGPSATTSAGQRRPRRMRSRAKSSQSVVASLGPSCSPSPEQHLTALERQPPRRRARPRLAPRAPAAGSTAHQAARSSPPDRCRRPGRQQPHRATEPLTRDYPRHRGVPPFARLRRSGGGYALNFFGALTLPWLS